MKTCRIWGDLTSDRVDEQYPVVNLCDECYEKLKDVEECILCEEEFNPDYGSCYKCGKSYEEEQKEYQERYQRSEEGIMKAVLKAEISFEEFNKFCIEKGLKPFPLKKFIFEVKDQKHFELSVKNFQKQLEEWILSQVISKK